MRKHYTAYNEGEDGRSPRSIATFANRADAERAAEGRGPMGYGNGHINTVTVYDSYDEYAARLPAGNRDRERWLQDQAVTDPDVARYLELRAVYEPETQP